MNGNSGEHDFCYNFVLLLYFGFPVGLLPSRTLDVVILTIYRFG